MLCLFFFFLFFCVLKQGGGVHMSILFLVAGKSH